MKQVIIRQPADYCTAWHLPSNHCYQDPAIKKKRKKSGFHREEFRPVTSSPFSDRWIMLHWETWSICVAQCFLAFAVATWAAWMCKLGARPLVLSLKKVSLSWMPPTWQEGQFRESAKRGVFVTLSLSCRHGHSNTFNHVELIFRSRMENGAELHLHHNNRHFFNACMQYLVLFILFILSFLGVTHYFSIGVKRSLWRSGGQSCQTFW